MNKPEHSPMPWIAGGWDGPIDCVYDANGDAVCEPSPPNAALIVTACNSYYENKQAIAELVEALTRFAWAGIDVSHTALIVGPDCKDVRAEARALIAKHKAKP